MQPQRPPACRESPQARKHDGCGVLLAVTCCCVSVVQDGICSEWINDSPMSPDRRESKQRKKGSLLTVLVTVDAGLVKSSVVVTVVVEMETVVA